LLITTHQARNTLRLRWLKAGAVLALEPAGAESARERVCSGSVFASAGRYYSPSFVDHVNDLEFRGLAGAQKSVDMYKAVLSNLEVRVEEQVIEGDRVTSRFVVTGTNHGKRVRLNGITISRLENGLIVEDWSVVETLALVRQLGAWRSVLMGLKQWRATR
jgi:predicted ester cyclase